MPTIGRLFVEIGGDTKQLNTALQQAVDAAKAAGIDVTKSGRSFINSFQDALNPTIALRQQIELLQKAGYDNAQIMSVMGDRIRSGIATATANRQQIDDVVKSVAGMGISFESVGRTIMDFVRSPVQTLQNTFTTMLGTLGPTAVGIGAVGAAGAVAGKYLFDSMSSAADLYESLKNTSAITGLSISDLQALTQVAREAGLESMDLGRVIGRLNQEMGSPAAGAFEKGLTALGISTKDLAGNQKDAVTILDELRVVLLSIPDPVERSQVGMAILGVRYRDL